MELVIYAAVGGVIFTVAWFWSAYKELEHLRKRLSSVIDDCIIAESQNEKLRNRLREISTLSEIDE